MNTYCVCLGPILVALGIQSEQEERRLISKCLNHQLSSEPLPRVMAMVCGVLPGDWAPRWELSWVN